MRYKFLSAGVVLLLLGVVVFAFSSPAIQHALGNADVAQLSQSEPGAGVSLHYVNSRVTLEEALANGVPGDSNILESSDGSERYLVLKDGHTLNQHVADVIVSFQDGMPIVLLRLDRVGAGILADMTRKIGQRMAMVFDGKVLSAPTIQSPIFGGQLIIVGNFIVNKAQDLARKLADPS